MYEDTWYSFASETSKKGSISRAGGHKRGLSLLQQPNNPRDVVKPLQELLDQPEDEHVPPPAHVPPRASSAPDLTLRARGKPRRRKGSGSTWEALHIYGHDTRPPVIPDRPWDAVDAQLVNSSMEEYTLYMDQLTLTERHLDALISSTSHALNILASLSESFRTVEEHTSSFRAQCKDLVTDQKRLQKLAHDVGHDLQYYAYLETITRQLNAPGATRLADDDALAEILYTLDSCVAFMHGKPEYKDVESYQARYRSLVTKALHLLETGFSFQLEKVSSSLAKQIASATSDGARHALAYGRFEELVLESRSLIPNMHKVFRRVFHEFGGPAENENINRDIYANTTQNLVKTYLAIRDRDLKPMVQHDVDDFKAEAKTMSAETATRNFIKQCFERAWNEFCLFKSIFAVEPHLSDEADSAFAILKLHQRHVVNIGNLATVAHQVQPVLQVSGLNSICTVVGWLTDEYLMVDPDDESSEFTVVCQELTARLLSEHLWAFADTAFEAQIAKLGKSPVATDVLKPTPESYPLIARAVELLSLYDGCMPKERSQKSSPMIFRLIQTSVQALQKAEARVRSQFQPRAPPSQSTADPDLFMVKNLLTLKNSLVSLEIGDVRDDTGAGGGAGSSGALLVAAGLQHFSAIWDALTPATSNIMGWMGSFIPWRRDGSGVGVGIGDGTTERPQSSAGGPNSGGGGGSMDASEMLDEMLRKCIIGFTQRWGQKMYEARISASKKGGGAGISSIRDLERDARQVLELVFSSQPEVSIKMMEAVEDSARAFASGKSHVGGGKG